MRFSLRVICNKRIIEAAGQRVAALTNYLSFFGDYEFLPYWKDDECVILELNLMIEIPDYNKIREYIRFISGAKNLSEGFLSNEWECAYYASLDELHSDKYTAFVVCNIF